MKICFVCNEYPPGPHGGIGTFTQMAARSLREAGNEVRVVGAYRPQYPAPDEHDDRGVQVVRQRIPRHRFGWVSARYNIYRSIAHWSRAGEIDIVELADAEGWAAYWPKLPIPVVVRLHGSYSYFANEMGIKPGRLMYRIERASLRRASAWCSVSAYTASKTRDLFGLTSGPDAVIYNPVEMPTDKVIAPRSSDNVVFTGTMVAKKGVISLFKSWRLVNQRCPAARLHVYGRDGRAPTGGSMKAYLLSLLDADQQATVQFYDHVSREELQNALSEARVAVFPSYAEAFAIAPMEAMLCGCPTIYSSRGSGPELMRHDVDGLILDPDNIDELAAAIAGVLSDDALAERLGHAGQQRIRACFTPEHALQENLTFYRTTIDAFRSQQKSVAALPTNSTHQQFPQRDDHRTCED